MSIELYSWDTPNGRKITVALEEMGLTYTVHRVNIFKGEQFDPAFLKISPNNRIPAIVDPEGPSGGPIRLFESGTILIYHLGRSLQSSRRAASGSKSRRGVRLLGALPHPNVLGEHPEYLREPQSRIGPCRTGAFDQLVWPGGRQVLYLELSADYEPVVLDLFRPLDATRRAGC
jgi:hypothetical protein